ncbi:MAG TPA: alpha/beta hydrolase [Acidimicrobiales bacterium]|nr:alpha/beta hydrolase [Acidimicrobiales bacterium]
MSDNIATRSETQPETSAEWRLDPELAKALAAFPMEDEPSDWFKDPNVLALLRSTKSMLEATGSTLPRDEMVEVSDRTIEGGPGNDALRLRIYKQCEQGSGAPLLVFFHGGGFIIGDPELEESRCLRFASEAGCIVVSADYRLAPEHPYPAGLDDCYAALEWAAGNAKELGADAGMLAVGGNSAGGALAAAVAQRAHHKKGPRLSLQLLLYPVLDDRMTTKSMREFTDTPIWTRGASEMMWDQYLGGDSQKPGQVPEGAAPSRATNLAGLPPAYVMTCELDPLRDEGIEYARRLLEGGVPTELHQYASTFHGFDTLAPDAAISVRAVTEQVDALRRGFLL